MIYHQYNVTSLATQLYIRAVMNTTLEIFINVDETPTPAGRLLFQNHEKCRLTEQEFKSQLTITYFIITVLF